MSDNSFFHDSNSGDKIVKTQIKFSKNPENFMLWYVPQKVLIPVPLLLELELDQCLHMDVVTSPSKFDEVL